MSDSEDTECGYFTVIGKTDKALHLRGADATHTYWVPRSEISDDGDITSVSDIDDEGELLLPEWLAVEKGFV